MTHKTAHYVVQVPKYVNGTVSYAVIRVDDSGAYWEDSGYKSAPEALKFFPDAAVPLTGELSIGG